MQLPAFLGVLCEEITVARRQATFTFDFRFCLHRGKKEIVYTWVEDSWSYLGGITEKRANIRRLYKIEHKGFSKLTWTGEPEILTIKRNEGGEAWQLQVLHAVEPPAKQAAEGQPLKDPALRFLNHVD